MQSGPHWYGNLWICLALNERQIFQQKNIVFVKRSKIYKERLKSIWLFWNDMETSPPGNLFFEIWNSIQDLEKPLLSPFYSAPSIFAVLRNLVQETWLEKSVSRNLVQEKWLTRKKNLSLPNHFSRTTFLQLSR